ncbi:SDR family NAD(P)-dependent oxidoreductase [Ensifer adhaerens]|uniref:SDR family NAD(P)-dependent oxidoreductase n=1 Tax=Ensifer adhaerens TaxID=106592 RepID=UPI001CBCC5EA|nr:SDR family NAD(P)-dependent oxidoreductase [Ensifer adhaerens]MBZ7921613.1 SDR family NAD(P)-dependent oxidoreductase [Ensifer adhaerens]UAX94032.1 SDR family NAD(P)-dependent oxidoreductase [Ensifer adhaerens]UAY01666.1 SDR family NAD(P)-dependent oxidoreductase [Ensifer adhaerens]UAY09050.1 SDR family NAD(P)-dependent oxidoreductase [Ensifer adhaerens]
MSIQSAQSENKLAWVTGASVGVGRALALKLVREGYSVVVTARSHEKLVDLQHEAAGEGRITVLDGDVTDPKDMERVLAAIEYDHGHLSLVILNAGVAVPVRGDDLHREAFEKSFAVNLNGVVNCLLPAVTHMKAQGFGHIAIVSSVAGYGGLPTSAAYGASKAALINMAESLKFDLDRIGIRLQIICPGFVDTPGTARIRFPRPALVSSEQAADRIIAGLKSRRFEISFPRHFTYAVKLLRLLPYSLYFALVRRLTGVVAEARDAKKHAGSGERRRQAV